MYICRKGIRNHVFSIIQNTKLYLITYK